MLTQTSESQDWLQRQENNCQVSCQSPLAIPVSDRIIWYAAMPTMTPLDFMARLENRGWPKTAILAAYGHWREHAAPYLERRTAPPSAPIKTPEPSDCMRARCRLAASLQDMEHPEDLVAYERNVLAIAAGLDNARSSRWSEIEEPAACARIRDAMRLDHHRLGGDLSERNKAMAQPLATLAEDILRNDDGSQWHVGTPAVGIDLPRLVQTIEAAGLRALSWPAASGTGARLLATLATGIAGANRDLQKATGWNGPLLGLAGHVALYLGAEREYGGLCYWHDRIAIATSAQGPWNVIAHEWIHALDCGMSGRRWARGIYDGVTISDIPHKEWNRLLTRLQSSPANHRDHRRIARRIVAGFPGRWRPTRPGSPDILFHAMLAEASTLEAQDWSGNESFDRLLPVMRRYIDICTQIFGDPVPSEWFLRVFVHHAVADLEVMRHARAGSYASVNWIAFRSRLDERIRADTLLGDRFWRHADRAELFAVSFEMAFGRRMHVLDPGSRRREALLDCPHAMVLAVYRAAWRRFFAASRDWWEKISSG